MPLQLKFLSSLGFLHFVSWHCVAPYVPLVAKGYGAGPAAVGMMMAAYALLPVVISIPTGVACDLVGHRRILIGSCLGTAVAAFSLLLSRSILAVTIALMVSGLFQILFAIAAQSAASHLVTRRLDVAKPRWYTRSNRTPERPGGSTHFGISRSFFVRGGSSCERH